MTKEDVLNMCALIDAGARAISAQKSLSEAGQIMTMADSYIKMIQEKFTEKQNE